jgi:hypothetical protein
MRGMCNRRNAKQLRADGASPGASRRIANAKLQVGGGEMKLGRLDSNQDYQGQNLACCQLHYGPMERPKVPQEKLERSGVEHDDAPHHLGPREAVEGVVHLVQLDVRRDEFVELEPALLVELDEVRDVEAEPGRPHHAAL